MQVALFSFWCRSECCRTGSCRELSSQRSVSMQRKSERMCVCTCYMLMCVYSLLVVKFVQMFKVINHSETLFRHNSWKHQIYFYIPEICLREQNCKEIVPPTLLNCFIIKQSFISKYVWRGFHHGCNAPHCVVPVTRDGWMNSLRLSSSCPRGTSDFCINYDHAPSLHLSMSSCILLRVFVPLSAIDKCFLLRHLLFCYWFFLALAAQKHTLKTPAQIIVLCPTHVVAEPSRPKCTCIVFHSTRVWRIVVLYNGDQSHRSVGKWMTFYHKCETRLE